MGCHTWFYRKIQRTQEEANDSCIKGIKKSRNLAWKIYHRPKSYRKINWAEDLYDGKEEDCLEKQLEIIKTSNRMIKAIKNGHYQKAVWNRQSDNNLTLYVEGKGLFIEDTGFHDCFRKGGYPEDILFSLQETIDYIDNPMNQVTIYENTINKLEEFWKKYPEGMINFG